MKILFHIEPLIFHGRPFHYAALFDFFVHLADSSEGCAGDDVRYISNPALISRAQGLHGLNANQVYALSESTLRDATQVASMEALRLLQQGGSAEFTANLARLYTDVLGDFQPDVIVTLTPSTYWKTAFPLAVVLHVDGGLFSRAPLPHVFFLDSDGLFGNSTLALFGERLRSIPPSPEGGSWLNLLRARFRQRLLAESPFHPLERELRAKFRRLLLLPLQFTGEFGFDLNCCYDSQGAYLMDMVERIDPDTAVIVAEHATAIWLGDIIDPETRAYVKHTHPNVIFAPGVREGVSHAGQSLLQHVDAVASISSSLGMQGVFFGKPLLALQRGHLAEFATWRNVSDFNADSDPVPDHTSALVWMMRHYYIPRQDLDFSRHILRVVAAANNNGLGRYPVIATDEVLLERLLRGASI